MSSREAYCVPASMDDLLEHRGLVECVINKHFRWARMHQRFDIQDMKQEGFIGLAMAMDRYEPHYDVSFATYAYWWVRQSIGRYVSKNMSGLSVPAGAMLSGKYSKTEKTRERIRAARCVLSLNAPYIRSDGSRMRRVHLADHSRQQWEVVADNEEAAMLMEWCRSNLSDRQFNVIYGRIVDGKTLEEMTCGISVNGGDLTRERVRQIEKKALEKIFRKYGREAVYGGSEEMEKVRIAGEWVLGGDWTLPPGMWMYRRVGNKTINVKEVVDGVVSLRNVEYFGPLEIDEGLPEPTPMKGCKSAVRQAGEHGWSCSSVASDSVILVACTGKTKREAILRHNAYVASIETSGVAGV